MVVANDGDWCDIVAAADVIGMILLLVLLWLVLVLLLLLMRLI